MKHIKKLAGVLAVGMVLALTGCAGYESLDARLTRLESSCGVGKRNKMHKDMSMRHEMGVK